LIGSSLDSGISSIVNVLGHVPLVDDLFTPGFDKFELGRTSPDVVPSDKLVKYDSKH
jgi:hypothetical protein